MEQRSIYDEAIRRDRQALAGRNKEEVAALAGGELQGESLILPFFDGEIRTDSVSWKIDTQSPLEEFITLEYLWGAKEAPGPGKEFVAFSQLAQGVFHQNAFQNDVLRPLAQRFGEDLAALEGALEKLGARRIKGADCTALIRIFPKVELKIVFYGADEEFPASANVLFDNKCVLHMATPSLQNCALALTKRLLES